jgi:hypothetical protein
MRKKYRLIKWSVICHSKDLGGVRVHDLEVKNRALLGKWLSKLYLKCFRNMGILTFGRALWQRRNTSSLMVVSPLGIDQRYDSGRICGWVTPRFENNTRLYLTLCVTKRLAKFMGSNPPQVSFRRDLIGPNLHLGMHYSNDWRMYIWRKG